MFQRAKQLVVVVVLLVGTAPFCRAQDDPDIPFPKQTLTLGGYLAQSYSLDNRDTNLTSGNFGFNYFVFDNLSLGLETGYSRSVQPGENTWVVGLSGTLRHHFLHYQHYTLFADVNFGPTYAGERIPPPNGTNFNFVTRAGLGATARIAPDWYLMTGVRFFHLSNAQLFGEDRNPAINGMEGYVGAIWMLR